MRHRDRLTDEQRVELDALDRALAGEPVQSELRELEELVRDVRATAPEMSPAFAARLEQEVQDGFTTPQQRVPGTVNRPWRGRRWMLLPALGSLAAVLVALVVVFGGAGETGSIESFSGEADSPSTARTEEGRPTGGGGAGDSAAGAGSAGAGAGPADVDSMPRGRNADPAPPPASAVAPAPDHRPVAPARARKVERNAVLALRTPDDEFDRTTDAVIATVSRFGGIVASSQIGDSDAVGGEATFDLRIPTERLDHALAALSKLGHVTERSQSLQDITASFTSAQERLTDARAERRGLLRALARATTQNAIDSLKAQLRTVSSRIAGLKGELSSLRRRADLSRVDLTVRGGGDRGSTGGGAWTPGDAAGDAIALAVRGGRRRRRESALDPA